MERAALRVAAAGCSAAAVAAAVSLVSVLGASGSVHHEPPAGIVLTSVTRSTSAPAFAVTLPDGRILVVGRECELSVACWPQVYDPVTRAWTSAANPAP